MIIKYFKIILNRFMKLSETQKMELFIQLLKRIGKNDQEINIIKQQFLTETNLNELNETLYRDFNLNFLEDIIMQFIEFQNMSDIVKNLKNIKIDESKITNDKTFQNFISNQDDPSLRLSFLLKKDISKSSKSQVYDLLQKLFTINKEQLSQEFDVNKRTLNKWLKYFFGQKYSGNRKIYLDDYVVIFKTFYLLDNENMKGEDLYKLIQKRIISGPSYFKNDIASYVGSNLVTQKNNVEQLYFYNYFDKFPYSLAQQIACKMGEPLKF